MLSEELPTLVISYFDVCRGPSIFYCRDEMSELGEFECISSILDFTQVPGIFQFNFNGYFTQNLVFEERYEDSKRNFE
ncbi:MAG: hypothetical protein ACFFAO_07290, partial [Candidatus Hermodarchaeota archaeon]